MMKKVGGSGYAILTKELLSKHSMIDIPLITATPQSLKGYGSIMRSKEESINLFHNETWPKPDGWRNISKGTGNEALPVTGIFDHFWKKYDENSNDFYVCCAKNEAVSRQYETAIWDLKNRYMYVREMNYHMCGNQIFYPTDTDNITPFIVLLGRSKANKHMDDIEFDDIKAFYFDGNYGLNIFTGTWHQPSFPYNIEDNLKLFNIQSSVHSCVVFDSIDECDKIMRIKLP
eukprot:358491_1